MSSHTCECGKVCGNAGGLASHQRRCLEHEAAVVSGRTGQLPLLSARDVVPDRGQVEMAAARDVSVLRIEGAIPDGVEALELTYVLLGREIDRAEFDKDRYGKINTAAKLLAVRKDLAALAPEGDAGTIDEFWAEMSANVQHATES